MHILTVFAHINTYFVATSSMQLIKRFKVNFFGENDSDTVRAQASCTSCVPPPREFDAHRRDFTVAHIHIASIWLSAHIKVSRIVYVFPYRLLMAIDYLCTRKKGEKSTHEINIITSRIQIDNFRCVPIERRVHPLCSIMCARCARVAHARVSLSAIRPM